MTLRNFKIQFAGLSLCVIGGMRPLGAQPTGYIKAYGAPPDAGVFLNGQYLGPAHRFTLSEKYPAAPGTMTAICRDPP